MVNPRDIAGNTEEEDSLFCCGSFPRLSHTSDLDVDGPMATLPGAWRCRVSAGTGYPMSVYQ